MTANYHIGQGADNGSVKPVESTAMKKKKQLVVRIIKKILAVKRYKCWLYQKLMKGKIRRLKWHHYLLMLFVFLLDVFLNLM